MYENVIMKIYIEMGLSARKSKKYINKNAPFNLKPKTQKVTRITYQIKVINNRYSCLKLKY